MARVKSAEEYEQLYRGSIGKAVTNFNKGVKNANWKTGKRINDWKSAWVSGVTATGVEDRYSAGIIGTDENYWKYKSIIGGNAKMRAGMELSAERWSKQTVPIIKGAIENAKLEKAKTSYTGDSKARAVIMMTSNYDYMVGAKVAAGSKRRVLPPGINIPDL